MSARSWRSKWNGPFSIGVCKIVNVEFRPPNYHLAIANAPPALALRASAPPCSSGGFVTQIHSSVECLRRTTEMIRAIAQRLSDRHDLESTSRELKGAIDDLETEIEAIENQINIEKKRISLSEIARILWLVVSAARIALELMGIL